MPSTLEDLKRLYYGTALSLSAAELAKLTIQDLEYKYFLNPPAGGGGSITSVNGYSTPSVTLGKADIGLGNADNTSDVNKPVSTAQAAADTVAKARANHTGTQSADTVVDGSTNKVYTAVEQTKLAGVATGATANDTDANLKNRSNHTGTQATSTIAGLDAALAALTSGKMDAGIAGLPAGSTLTVTYAGSWPARPTSRADIVVIWKGPDPSPAIVSSGTGGMRDGIDVRFITP